ncbi:MAG: FtsX-like permease family protein, partial [Gemmatimonadota bacterium]|nr:FtsX-like permease family protein [Gemmatimonadota bacterium]
TTLMATFERRREFAVMLAMGASPRSVVGTVLSEAVATGFIGLALGTAVTAPLLVWFSTAPPDIGWLFGNLTVEGVLLTPSLRVGTNVPAWTWATIGLIVTALVSALYPAIRAARVPPADTLSGL